MKLQAILVRAMAILAVMFVVSHFILLQHLPDHNNARDSHPMVDNSVKTFRREMSAPDTNMRIEDTHSRTEKLQKEEQGQQQQQPKRRRKKKGRLQILANERKPSKPTAQTISPYLNHSLFTGKERLLTMLHEAHYFNDSAAEFFSDKAKVETLAQQLPPWETITQRLGGDRPAIVGLDTCQAFRDQVPPEDRFLGVAGLFATGTNLLANLLVANCQNTARKETHGGTGVRWQVNWGKHSPARYRLQNRIDPKLHNQHFFPVVTVRHPYSWMQSMCRQRYSTHWFHNAQEHCPNLVPNDIDRKWYQFVQEHGKRGVHSLYKDPWLRDNLLDLANFTLDSTAVPVRVRYKSGTLFHESLAHQWNEWYNEYIEAEFPRIIVRLEDLVFHAKQVVTDICTCIGGTVAEDFRYCTETAKVGDDNIHGKDRTNLYKWFTKWHLEDRTKNMTTDDRAYAKEHLDSKLLKTFQYNHPS